MNQQQKFLHVVSILLAAFLLLIFYLLGGGTSGHKDKECKMDNNTINLEVPLPNTDELSANRIEAVMRAVEEENDEERTQNRQQSSSFQWITAHGDTLPSVEEQPQKVSPPQKAAAPRPTKPTQVLSDRQAFIAQTRQKLAKQYGVELDAPTSTPQDQVKQEVPRATVSTSSSASAGFYGLQEATAASTDIRAVVHGEHRNLERGAIVKLRLLDDILINGTLIPANTFLYGKLGFAACRATIRIQNIQYQQTVYPFEGTIYDKDGFEGLYVPDNRIDEATRKAGSQALGNVDLRIPSVSFIASAANAAVSAVQSVAQQAVGEQKINISSNYLVTIKQPSK